MISVQKLDHFHKSKDLQIDCNSKNLNIPPQESTESEDTLIVENSSVLFSPTIYSPASIITNAGKLFKDITPSNKNPIWKTVKSLKL